MIAWYNIGGRIMKKLPKLLFVPIIAVTAALFFSFSGCGSIGAFYALKDAYDKGYVTVEDLESIAAYHNGDKECEQTLPADVENDIKKCEAASLRSHGEKHARPDGVHIVAYYGEYNGFYAVIIESDWVGYPTDVVNYYEDIGGVSFHYTSHGKIQVWTANG